MGGIRAEHDIADITANFPGQNPMALIDRAAEDGISLIKLGTHAHILGALAAEHERNRRRVLFGVIGRDAMRRSTVES
jgi:hypothetical protein